MKHAFIKSSGANMLLLGAMTMLLCQCSGKSASEHRGTLLRSGSPESGPRRAAANRPIGFKEDKGPFESDRMLINAHMYRTAASHGESHGRQALELDGYSHPACVGFSRQIKVRCPLSEIKWKRFKDIPGGIFMEARSRSQKLGQYRRRLLCHMAFGATRDDKAVCPLHLGSIRVKLLGSDSRMVLQLVTMNKEQIQGLRKLVRRLFD